MVDERRLWIVNQYASQPNRGYVCRHHYLARELLKLGVEVTIFAAAGHHLHHKRPDGDALKNGEMVDGVRYVWIKTPSVSQDSKVARVLAWFVFALGMFLAGWRLPSPTTVIHSSPSLIPYISSWSLARFRRARLVFEFRDVWPATFWMMARYSQLHPVVLLNAVIERFALSTADHVFATMPLGWKRLKQCGVTKEKFSWVPNGVSLSPVAKAVSLPKTLLDLLDTDRDVILYAGTMGQANSLDVVIDAAAMVQDLPIQFVFVGYGDRRSALQTLADEKQLNNVSFHPPIEKQAVPLALAEADALIISWQDLPLYQYGTSANKLPEYFASRKPVIQAYSGSADAVDEADAGITVPANDPKALAEAFRTFHHLGEGERARLGANGRRYAEAHFDFFTVAKTIAKQIGGVGAETAPHHRE